MGPATTGPGQNPHLLARRPFRHDNCGGPGDYGINFPDAGNWMPVLGSNPPSPAIYAVSIPGVSRDSGTG